MELEAAPMLAFQPTARPGGVIGTGSIRTAGMT
jgi:hypothetical protein